MSGWVNVCMNAIMNGWLEGFIHMSSTSGADVPTNHRILKLPLNWL